jgi:hypothetical protein
MNSADNNISHRKASIRKNPAGRLTIAQGNSGVRKMNSFRISSGQAELLAMSNCLDSGYEEGLRFWRLLVICGCAKTSTLAFSFGAAILS